jgi:pantoate kinase|tara:strand:- start:1228 stop:2046 length:819 start_codon:yes stop_codon:yes gene_type:complete
MTRAFSPANISCIFRVIENKNPKKKHSLGVGFTVDQGVIVSAKKSKKNIVLLNNKKTKLPTITTVVKELTDKPLKINISSKLPFGSGFGLSGASALAAAYAINKLLNLKKSKKELAMIAHTAEVINKTGLGDISGQFNAGFMAKLTKGHPLKVKNLPIKEKYVHYKVFSKLSTSSVITSKKKKNKLNKAGRKALAKIKKLEKPSLKDIIKISKEFALNSKLLKNKKVINQIKNIEINNGNASMIMLGNAVFSDIPFKGSKRLKITKKSAHLI